VTWTQRIGLLAIASTLPLVVVACGLDDTAFIQNGSGLDGGSGSDATFSADGSSPNDGGVATDGAAIDGAPPGPDGGPPPPPPPLLVFANTQTELYSFDVGSNLITHLGSFTNCGSNSNPNDLAIDSVGQMFLLQKSDAIYKLAADAGCSFREVLSENTGSTNKIGGRFNGAPGLLANNDNNNNVYSVDPSSGTTTLINDTIFPDDGTWDIVCSRAGTCWGAFDHSRCGAGSASSCLYSFQDDGGGTAVSLGEITVHPVGLAYADGALYSFGDDGHIAKIPLAVTPLAAAVLSTNLAPGTNAPGAWRGATSPL